MKRLQQTNIIHSLSAAVLMGTTVGVVNAGGMVDVDIDFATDFPDPLTISNPYWPLEQGKTFIYEAIEGDECTVDVFSVTNMEKNDFVAPYEQITARVVNDVSWADADCNGIGEGDPLETTRDWYAQDKFGHIWYFGEDTITNDGSTEGSWEAGKDVAGVGSIAEPGIIMLAHPDVSTDGSVLASPGLSYQQEYYEEEAEDMGKVLQLNASVTLGMENMLADDSYSGCLKTKEWSPLERGAVEHKYYCPYVGLVLVNELMGGPTVRVELVNILP